ncbi:unnamed protein product [Prorocentrum cordatum]|uniref:Uncharacterized protein n=1 Tax=Prorocentrum cordatum TaxID=2364126 RepID=A0ABN9VFG0_9DINO|nr:unnamed protein product [Polarella glacialis]
MDTPARQPAFARGDSTRAGRSNACVASIVLTSLCLSALLVVGGRHLLDQEDRTPPGAGRPRPRRTGRCWSWASVRPRPTAPTATARGPRRSALRPVRPPSSAGGNSSEALAAGAGEGPGDGNLSGPACSPALCGALDRAGETFKDRGPALGRLGEGLPLHGHLHQHDVNHHYLDHLHHYEHDHLVNHPVRCSPKGRCLLQGGPEDNVRCPSWGRP